MKMQQQRDAKSILNALLISSKNQSFIALFKALSYLKDEVSE
jgi:hypothetical protein